MNRSRLQHFPITFFSIALGLAGFTLALSRAEAFVPISVKASFVLRWVALGVFALTGVFYLLKVVYHRSAVAEELMHPVRMNFFPLIAKILLVFAIIFMHQAPSMAEALWWLGLTAQVIATFFIMGQWIHNEQFSVSHISPAVFMPIVGNMLIPIAGIEFAPKELNWFFYSIGIVFWIVMFTIVANRLFFHHPIPEKLLPTLFIMMAPPAIGAVAYLRLTGEVDVFLRVQYYFALFMAFLLLTQFRVFLRLKFYLSWWAYTFPMAAVTTATFVMWHHTHWTALLPIGLGLLLTLGTIIVILVIRTTIAMRRREICVEEADHAPMLEASAVA
jgi:tellurite resistance protein